MSKHKQGFVLLYTLLFILVILNILIFMIINNLNITKYYNDKDKYYQIFILEERAKRHVLIKFSSEQPQNNETELLYHDYGFVYLRYQYDVNKQIWNVHYRINYDDIDQYGIIYYDVTNTDIWIEIQ